MAQGTSSRAGAFVQLRKEEEAGDSLEDLKMQCTEANNLTLNQLSLILEKCSANNIGDIPIDKSWKECVSINLDLNKDVSTYNEAYPDERSEVRDAIKTATETKSRSEKEKRTILFSSIGLLVDTQQMDSDIGLPVIALKMKEITLHKSEETRLCAGRSGHHFYFVQDSLSSKISTLVVTIVFRGDFEGFSYIPGNICVQLRRLSKEGKPLQIPSTKDGLGRVVIFHEVKNAVIESGLFDVVMTAGTVINYSISMSCTVAHSAGLELEREIARWLSKQKESIDAVQKAASLSTDIALLERKRKIEIKMREQARKKCDQCELDIENYDIELEDRRDELEDGGNALVKRMQVLEVEYAHWFRLLTLRSKMLDNLSISLSTKISQRDAILRQNKKIAEDFNEVKFVLSQATSILWSNKASMVVNNMFQSKIQS